jgi:phosphatidylethanolamine/phosphatidyl-N-methylethanolamine N-methyltransferase
MDTEKVTKVYSAYSGFYDLLFGKIFHHSRAAAIDLLDLKSGDRVLEVGVGTGLSLPLYPRNCSIIGIDLTGPMLEQGAKKIKRLGLDHVYLQQMDATHMAFRDSLFDAVVAAYVMSTVPNPRAVLAEMIRVCRPGGRIVLLNHFSNGNRLVSRVEKTISPLCTWIGFRSDLSLESLLDQTCLDVEHNLKVNPFNYWHIVQCVNRKPINGAFHQEWSPVKATRSN